ncbi:MAG TPA: hypothetical protein VH115_08520 [Solirubrobacteraceae bacterium]|nr:hypothetical protein [Solirubrobacteraceae bacterium]
MALPFGVSIAALSLAQGAVVAMPEGVRDTRLEAFRGRRWALVPPLSVIAFVLIARAAEHASAESLTYLALVAVPALAALALGWLMRGARPALALVTLALFALAWADRRGLAGEGAALALSALSCVALGVLIAAVTPARWLAAGIVAMAVADTALVVSDQLQRPNSVLNAARPAAGLPRLQSAVFGSAVMGYGDLFVAGAFGGLLAIHLSRREQLRGSALAVALALAFDLLFLVVDELPATVPVALALIVLAVVRRRSGADASGRRRAIARRRGRELPTAPALVRPPVRRRS